LILSLTEHSDGVQVPPGAVGYDVMRNTACVGPEWIEGHALVWQVGAEAHEEPKLAVDVELDPRTDWLMRCDRVDFPPGGVAYLHTHPGPGIRCLLHGAIRVEAGGESHTYGPLGAWFESGPEPVFAAASDTEETSFVRVLWVPQEWEGRRTIRYVNAEDEDKPKTQRATVFLEVPLTV
jgi:quercetin dioxygenase-like cupin family protein